MDCSICIKLYEKVLFLKDVASFYTLVLRLYFLKWLKLLYFNFKYQWKIQFNSVDFTKDDLFGFPFDVDELFKYTFVFSQKKFNRQSSTPFKYKVSCTRFCTL